MRYSTQPSHDTARRRVGSRRWGALGAQQAGARVHRWVRGARSKHAGSQASWVQARAGGRRKRAGGRTGLWERARAGRAGVGAAGAAGAQAGAGRKSGLAGLWA